MKRMTALLLLLCLLLTACAPKRPEKTADGSPWQDSWETVGTLLGVEPAEDWAVNRSEDVLAAEGTFYVVWTKGEAFTYPNADGDTVTAYDGQIHLVAIESDTEEAAAEHGAVWEQLIRERYPEARTEEKALGGQDFCVSCYDFPAGDSQLHGASATALRGGWALHIDVITREEDPMDALTAFLSRCHWAE